MPQKILNGFWWTTECVEIIFFLNQLFPLCEYRYNIAFYYCSRVQLLKWANVGLLQANYGKMLVNDGDMLVNYGEMIGYTHFTIIDKHFTVISEHFTIINEHFTIISLNNTMFRSFDHHWEAAPTSQGKPG